MGDVRLVADREIRQRLRGRSFYVSTALMVAAVLAAAVLYRVLADDDPASATLAVTGPAPAGLDEALVASGSAHDVEITTESFETPDGARAALADGDVDAVLDAGRRTVLWSDEEDLTLQAAVQQAWAATTVRGSLDEAGLSPEQVDDALASTALTAEVVDVDDDEPDGVAYLVGMVAGVLLFMAIQMYGGFILMGVVEEKSSAVIEVLLSRVRATQLLAGKVLGIGAVAVAQFVIVVAAGFVALGISGVDVPGGVWAALPATLVWFVGGFAIYAFLFALAGAMVSRQEDAQGAAVPVNILLITGYIAMFLFIGNPDHAAAQILVLFPPFTPLLMPMRIAAGESSVPEVAAALVLMALTVVALARVSGGIYSHLVLRRGSRIRWLEAVRSAG
jgi:ABC-2 type transport system permease protein